jgi:hypothetical protein
MDVAATIMSAVIASFVAAGVNTLFFIGVQRRFVERDRLLKQLTDSLNEYRAQVEVLDKQRIAELDSRITAGAKSRKEIHEHIRDHLVTRQECAAQKQQMTDAVSRIEKRLDGFAVVVGETNSATARMAAIYEILAKNIGLFNIKTQQPG